MGCSLSPGGCKVRKGGVGYLQGGCKVRKGGVAYFQGVSKLGKGVFLISRGLQSYERECCLSSWGCKVRKGGVAYDISRGVQSEERVCCLSPEGYRVRKGSVAYLHGVAKLGKGVATLCYTTSVAEGCVEGVGTNRDVYLPLPVCTLQFEVLFQPWLLLHVFTGAAGGDSDSACLTQ